MSELPYSASQTYLAVLMQHVLSGPVPEDPLARAPWLARLEALEDVWGLLSPAEQALVEERLAVAKEATAEAVLLTERFRG